MTTRYAHPAVTAVAAVSIIIKLSVTGYHGALYIGTVVKMVLLVARYTKQRPESHFGGR